VLPLLVSCFSRPLCHLSLFSLSNPPPPATSPFPLHDALPISLRELQGLYEAIPGRQLDRRNFRRRVLSLGLLRPLGRLRRGAHRPAALYAFRSRRPMIVTVL